jgi:hypothetical protein
MRRVNLLPLAALVLLCGVSGCLGGDKRGLYIRQLIDSTNEVADILAQIKDTDSAERFKLRLKACTEHYDKIKEKLGAADKPEELKIDRQFMGAKDLLIAKRLELGRDLEMDDLPEDPEKKGEKIIPEAEAEKIIDWVNRTIGYADQFSEEIKLCMKRLGAEIARIRLLDPAVAEVIKEPLKAVAKEPDFTIDEISPALYKEQYLMRRMVNSLQDATKIAKSILSEATANAALPGLTKELRMTDVFLSELKNVGKNAPTDIADLKKMFAEVQSARGSLFSEVARIKRGVVKWGRIREEDVLDPAMWPPVRDIFEQFEQLEFDWEPPAKGSFGMGMGMPGMGMPGMGKGGMAGMQGGMAGMQGAMAGQQGGMAGMRGMQGGMGGRPPR